MRTSTSLLAANGTVYLDCGAVLEPGVASVDLFQQQFIDHLLVEDTVSAGCCSPEFSCSVFLPAVTLRPPAAPSLT